MIPDNLKERVEMIVQKEVQERMRQMDSNGQAQFLEKKLKLAEEKTDALKNLLTSKDDEMERILH